MKDLEEELKSRIKVVFEDFDDGASEEGWNALRRKYPAPGRKLPLYWLSGIAATLLLVAGLWMFRTPKTIKKAEPLTRSELDGRQGRSGKSEPSQPTINQPFGPGSDNTTAAKRSFVRKYDHLPVPGTGTSPVQESIESHPVTDRADSVPNILRSTAPVIAQTKIVDEITVPANEVIAKGQTDLPVAEKKSTETYLAEQSQLMATEKVKRTKVKKNSAYEIFTGTFLNYGAENESKVSAGFGLNASLKVSNGLYLSVGAGVSKNNLSYNHVRDEVPQASPISSTVTTQSLRSNSAMAFYAQAPEEMVAKFNAQLLSLDLPVMLKFYPSKKHDFYVATGFNSNSYFAQKYAFTYNVVTRSPLSGSTSFDREETEKKDFSGFEFANSAIIAIGITQKLNNTNSLIVEPYFKPALSRMGDKGLKINAVGVNLKFSFSPSK